MSYTIYERCNHTELYQICLRLGFRVKPSEPREKLIAYILGDEEPQELGPGDHAIDSWRDGLIGFADDRWKVLGTQLKCPLRFLKHPTTPNPKPCYGCIDTQVIACICQNKEHQHLIEPFRLNKKNR